MKSIKEHLEIMYKVGFVEGVLQGLDNEVESQEAKQSIREANTMMTDIANYLKSSNPLEQ